MTTYWKLNTSNPGKLEEFTRLFSQAGAILEATAIDVPEIDADPLSVIAHKATLAGENILVEDTSLNIEGAAVGIHIRWLLDHLKDYIGHPSEWIVLLAHRKGQEIVVYRGVVQGTITDSSGISGFGFDPVFLPNGSIKTLAEEKPDYVNARAKVVNALFKGDVWKKHPLVEDWKGPWQ